ncbi:GGDEF domain-containing protein [Vibrio echinoideorum]|uniref:GGDEF domain-containing protein n=1 Tax=Vibrio echinoideorum TaxID=2100116 RepID=UPI001080E752|nr:GGDEF domain-containing protein [Vibrio echinoideorum]
MTTKRIIKLMPKFKMATISLIFSSSLFLLLIVTFGASTINNDIKMFDLSTLKLDKHKENIILFSLFTESQIYHTSGKGLYDVVSVDETNFSNSIFTLSDPELNRSEVIVRNIMHKISYYRSLGDDSNNFVYFYRSYSGLKYIFPDKLEKLTPIENFLSSDICSGEELCSTKVKEHQLADRVIISPPHTDVRTNEEVISIVAPVYERGEIIGDYVSNVNIGDYLTNGLEISYEKVNDINNLIVTYPGYPYLNFNHSKTVVADNETTYTYRYPYSKLFIDYCWVFVILFLASLNYLFYVSKAKITKDELVDAKHTALKDELTGLYNRRIYNEPSFNQAVLGKACSVIAIDGDQIKKINDNLGHNWGDEVIQHIAHSMKDVFRRDDFLVRVGGDEFIVIMPNCSFENAKKASEILKAQVTESKVASLGFDVSVSVGVAFKGASESLESVLHKADEKLYEQKAQR